MSFLPKLLSKFFKLKKKSFGTPFKTVTHTRNRDPLPTLFLNLSNYKVLVHYNLIKFIVLQGNFLNNFKYSN